MATEPLEILKGRLSEGDYKKLEKIDNPKLYQFIAKYVELCNPEKIFVSASTDEDIRYIREKAIENGEESKLATEGHTVHFDNYYDQGRDKEHTCILVPEGVDLGEAIKTKQREGALKEIHEIMKNIMVGKELYICFFCLGPCGSEFSIPAVQLTDSSYVAHSDNI
ncbi:MAG: phosphoenolpyruvate carboxykinase, partial [Candidatus Coatesbacteria bacterium]